MNNEDKIDWSLEPPSKSQLKRDMTSIQKLGEELVTLNKKQLEKLSISDSLRANIAEFSRLPNSNEARRRHLQFIGKLMRSEDHERIQSELDKMRTPDRAQVRRAQLIEQWGDKLLAGSEAEINNFVIAYPLAERQAIRQIIRNVSKDNEEAAKVHRRRLMSYIKEYIE